MKHYNDQKYRQTGYGVRQPLPVEPSSLLGPLFYSCSRTHNSYKNCRWDSWSTWNRYDFYRSDANRLWAYKDDYDIASCSRRCRSFRD